MEDEPAGSSPGRPFGEPMAPGPEALGVPGWPIPPELRLVLDPVPPMPMPVVVVEEPPGADVMPAEPGFAGAAPTGGAPPTPGAVHICTPPAGAAVAPCASMDEVAPIRDIATSAERCSLCRIVELRFLEASRQRPPT